MHVGSLNLEDNWIEGDGAKAIADMLKDNISITDLVSLFTFEAFVRQFYDS